jgi:hypothetical protein
MPGSLSSLPAPAMQLAVLLVAAASAGCERKPDPDRAAQVASASATSSAAADAAPSAKPDTPVAAPRAADGAAAAAPGVTGNAPPATVDPLMIRTEAGLIPAAQAERVLHVGDSMVPLVANYLRQIYWADKRNYWVVSQESSTTLSWADDRLLQEAMYQYDPQVVLISLGSNELFVPDPARRAPAVRQLVKDTRGRPCMWISPPSWKKDTGILRVVRENLGHCRYFDSTDLDLPRMDDGRHPDWTGGYQWSKAVWQALGGTEPVPTSTRGAE